MFSYFIYINTFAADDEYNHQNRENISFSLRVQLSKKQMTFCRSSTEFLEFTLNFKYFREKNEPHGSSIS